MRYGHVARMQNMSGMWQNEVCLNENEVNYEPLSMWRSHGRPWAMRAMRAMRVKSEIP